MRTFLKLCRLILPILLLVVALQVTAQDAEPTPNRPVLPTDPIGGTTPEAPGQPNTEPVATEETDETAPEQPADDVAEPTPTPEPTQPTVPELPEVTSDGVCPTIVQPAFDATQIVCEGVASGQICIGNGTVEVDPKASVGDITFASAGDVVPFTSLDEIRVRSMGTEGDQWSVAVGQLPLPTTADQQVFANILLFGDVTVVDRGEPPQVSGGASGTIIGSQGLNVRRAPNNQAVIVYQVRAGEDIIVTGRSADNQWLRIQIPTRFAGIGWVYAPYVEVAGGAENLAVVNQDSPPPNLSVSSSTFSTKQAISLVSALTPAECEQTPDSGIMIQSPSSLQDAVRVRINDVILEINGTVFVSAQPDGFMTVAVPEGSATLELNEQRVEVNAGAQATITMTDTLSPSSAPVVTAYNADAIANLPIRLAPRPFVAAEPDPNAAAAPAVTSSDDTSDEPAEPTEPQVCTITAISTVKNLRAGPGTTFDVINTLEGEASIEGIGQSADEFGFVWYETPDGWIRADTVRVTDACAALPQTSPDDSTTDATVDEPAVTASLVSSEVGEVCGTEPVTLTQVSDGTNFAVEIGGAWTVSAGTTVRVETAGGDLRPEYGDYIRFNDASGNVLARSGNVRTLEYTFVVNTTFGMAFSAANQNEVTATITCS